MMLFGHLLSEIIRFEHQHVSAKPAPAKWGTPLQSDRALKCSCLQHIGNNEIKCSLLTSLKQIFIAEHLPVGKESIQTTSRSAIQIGSCQTVGPSHHPLNDLTPHSASADISYPPQTTDRLGLDLMSTMARCRMQLHMPSWAFVAWNAGAGSTKH